MTNLDAYIRQSGLGRKREAVSFDDKTGSFRTVKSNRREAHKLEYESFFKALETRYGSEIAKKAFAVPVYSARSWRMSTARTAQKRQDSGRPLTRRVIKEVVQAANAELARQSKSIESSMRNDRRLGRYTTKLLRQRYDSVKKREHAGETLPSLDNPLWAEVQTRVRQSPKYSSQTLTESEIGGLIEKALEDVAKDREGALFRRAPGLASYHYAGLSGGDDHASDTVPDENLEKRQDRQALTYDRLIDEMTANCERLFGASLEEPLNTASNGRETLFRSAALGLNALKDSPAALATHAITEPHITKTAERIEKILFDIDVALEDFQNEDHRDGDWWRADSHGKFTDALVADLVRQRSLLEKKLDGFREYIKIDGLSAKNIALAQRQQLSAAKKVVRQMTEKAGAVLRDNTLPQDKRLRASQVLREANALEKRLSAKEKELTKVVSHERPENVEEKFRVFETLLLNELKEFYDNHTTFRKQNNIGEAEKELKAAFIDTLNRDRPWTRLDKELLVTANGKTAVFRSRITPASQTTVGGYLPQLAQKYRNDKLNGVSALDYASEHATNLNLTEFTDEKGKVLFQGVRHGILSAFKIKGKAQRAEANKKRAMEVAEAALTQNEALLRKALQGEIVDLDIASVSLVTPDTIRTKASRVGMQEDAVEKEQLSEQFEAWDAIRGEQELMVTHPDTGEVQSVTVKVNTLAFNFGVNAGAMGNSPALESQMWTKEANKRNEASLTRLVGGFQKGAPAGGLTGAWMQRQRDEISELKSQVSALEGKAHDQILDGSDQKRLADLQGKIAAKEQDLKVAQELTNQIRDIWNTQSYRSEGNEPYKMVSRLALLSHMIGITPSFNCKSGKDRTGLLDVETKFLAARIARTGLVPKPDSPLNEQEKEMYDEFALRSGNLEIQRYNTGLAGFKTDGVPAIYGRMTESAAELFKGGKSYVKH